MKTWRKSLSVLLAALLVLSAMSGLAAFAEWESKWIPVYASAEGRADGDLYLDFDKLTGVDADLRAKLQTAPVAIRFLEDPQAANILSRPDAYSLNDLSFEVRVSVPDGEPLIYTAEQCPLMNAIVEYAAKWVKLAFSSAGLKLGDYYFDVAEYKADLVAKTAAEQGADPAAIKPMVEQSVDEVLSKETFYYNTANRHLKVVFVGGDLRTQILYYPLFGEADYANGVKYIKQCTIDAPVSPGSKPDSGSGGSGGFIEWMKEIFQKIMDFFRKLFGG